MITFGFIIEIYIQGRALILENIAYSCNCKIEDRKLDVQPRLSVRQSVYLSVYLFIYPSVNPSIPRNQNQIKSRSLVRLKTGPQGFWGSGENGYLFSGSWGTLVIIFRDLRSKLIVLGIKGALQTCKKNLTLKEKPSFRLIFFKKNLRLLGEMGGELCYYLNICAYFKLKTSLFSILPEESSVFLVNP